MITYKQGNLFENLSNDKKNVILHVCNDAGGWGSGFVLAVDKYCGTKPRSDYRKWYVETHYVKNNFQVPFKLGQIQVCNTDDKNTFVINMIGQSCPGGHTFTIGNQTINYPPIRYQSLQECLYRVKELVDGKNINLIAPMFGAGLAGGAWSNIEELINNAELDITIYQV